MKMYSIAVNDQTGLFLKKFEVIARIKIQKE